MRKKTGFCILACVLLAGFLSAAPAKVFAKESSRDQVASGDELTKAREVGVEGMVPVHGLDVADGVYEVEVESSSSMFRVEKAELRVEEGNMWAVLTLSGTGYEALYMGTAGEAAKSDPSEQIGYVEDEEGSYTYTIPVEALDQPLDCAAFSKNKQKWYGREILFLAGSLPKEAILVELPDYQALKQAAKEKRIQALREESGSKAETENKKKDSWEPAEVALSEGEYEISLDFAGGSGRSFVESPAILAIRQGRAYGRIRWSSPHYDYMKAGDEVYLPVNSEGNAEFEIPIPVFDEALTVIGDTTAMGTPHEIEYQLTFHQASVSPREKKGRPFVLGGAVLLFGIFLFLGKMRKGAKKK